VSSIAIVSSFAPSEDFGGPARIFHMRRTLEQVGHSVVHVVVSANHLSRSLRPVDLVEVVERPFRAAVDHMYNDVDLADRAAADPRVERHITEHLKRHNVSVVILEQAFLINTIERVVTTLGASLVYSCENIEYRLRADLERFEYLWKRPLDRATGVRDLEQKAATLATVVTAICPTDQRLLLEEFGVQSVLIPNGSSIADVTLPSDGANMRAGEPVDFVMAGSSYWPNLEGFASIAKPSLAFLPPTTRIHIAGSMSTEVLKWRDIDRRHSINASRIVRRGFLEMNELIATMHASRAVLVPVFTGEGSNLKSADALACGRPVIMTERATRGYEDVLAEDDEGVTVVADAAEFRRAMSAALSGLRPSGSVGATRRKMLSWSRRLAPLQSMLA
jgi:glycosyltransferase involved in cell wall biosynthesis